MLQIPMIDRTARLRRLEIAQEICASRFMGSYISRARLQKRDQLDLNIRVSLRPGYLSRSGWGRVIDQAALGNG